MIFVKLLALHITYRNISCSFFSQLNVQCCIFVNLCISDVFYFLDTFSNSLATYIVAVILYFYCKGNKFHTCQIVVALDYPTSEITIRS